MKQYISMEAKSFGGKKYYLFEKISLKEGTHAQIPKFGLKKFPVLVKNALASPWLPTRLSQREAKSETKDFNGSQEAKGLD